MAEMTRGAGANSNNIPEFAFFIEATAYIDAYNSYTGIYRNRDDALEYVLKQCAEDSTQTIGEILFRRFRIDQAVKEVERRISEEKPQPEDD